MKDDAAMARQSPMSFDDLAVGDLLVYREDILQRPNGLRMYIGVDIEGRHCGYCPSRSESLMPLARFRDYDIILLLEDHDDA